LLIAQYPPAGDFQPGCCRFYTVLLSNIFTPANPGQVYVMLIPPWQLFQDADCARKKFNDLNTVILGSGHFSLFEYKPLYGFNSGYRAYDDFNFTADSIGFTILSDPWRPVFSPILDPNKTLW
jgi:hypothetical protein